MVKKLYKHEFLAWLRILPFFWGAVLLTAGVNRIVQIFEADNIYYRILFVASIMVYVVALLVTLAAPTVFGIVRFYKNFFTGEGYLTFTLPATKRQLLLVKISTAVCFSVISVLVCLLSGVVIMAGEVLTEVSKVMPYLMKDVSAQDAMHFYVIILEFGILLLMADVSNHFLYYTCICLGQTFRKNRVLAAVGVYFAYYMLSQMLGTVITISIGVMGELGVLDTLLQFADQNPPVFLHCTMWIGILLTALGNLIYWAICHWVIHRKLNLE